jgi:hypothetical protein
MYASGAAAKSSTVVESQSRAKNISVFSRPKKPSQAALSGEHPLRDIERTSFASVILVSQPGQRSCSREISPSEFTRKSFRDNGLGVLQGRPSTPAATLALSPTVSMAGSSPAFLHGLIGYTAHSRPTPERQVRRAAEVHGK